MNKDPKVEEYILSAPDHFRDIMLRIRKLIYEIVPDATEAIKWNTPVFSRGKNICYIACFKNHVTFSFYNGRMLKDPDHILEGTGKMMKFIKLRHPEDIDIKRLRLWILEGFYV